MKLVIDLGERSRRDAFYVSRISREGEKEADTLEIKSREIGTRRRDGDKVSARHFQGSSWY